MQRALDRADASKEARLKALDSNLPEYKDLVKQIESEHSVYVANLMAGSSSSKDIKKLMTLTDSVFKRWFNASFV